MKSKFIIITAIFSVFLLTMIPSITAFQTQTIKKNVSANRAEILQLLEENNLPDTLIKIILAIILVPTFVIIAYIMLIFELWRQGFWS